MLYTKDTKWQTVKVQLSLKRALAHLLDNNETFNDGFSLILSQGCYTEDVFFPWHFACHSFNELISITKFCSVRMLQKPPLQTSVNPHWVSTKCIADKLHWSNLKKSYLPGMLFLSLDAKLDHCSINPLKAEAKAPKASSATRLADLAGAMHCSV